MTALDPTPADTATRTREPCDYMLAPATRLLWRSPSAVHLELGSRAVLVEGLPVSVIRQVATRPRAEVDQAMELAVSPEAGHALRALAEAGYLWPRRPSPVASGNADATEAETGDDRLHIATPRLGAEFASLTARHGADAGRVLAQRRQTSVQIFGSGRVSTHLGAVLAAAGVGRVNCVGGGTTLLHHAVPGGALPADEGQPRSRSSDRAIRAAAPGTTTSPPDADERPDLTVLAVDAPVDDDRRRALHARNAPYLAVSLDVDHGVVGPLVLPGLTSCLHCADLHRLDRDPAWAALAAQLSVPHRYGPASDVATATIVVGVAAMQALTFLDGGDPAVIDATLELHLPDWRLRRRSWPAHPECDCAHADGLNP